MNWFLLWLLVVPVAACVLIAAGWHPKKTALMAAIVNLLTTLVVAFSYNVASGGYQFETNVPVLEWPGFFLVNFHIGVDGLNLPLLLLTTIVTVSALAIAPENVKRVREFYIYLLLLSVGAVGAFLSLDLFFLYIFHEVALIPTFLLIGIWGTHDRKFSATQLTLYLSAGSLILLAGLLAFYFTLPAGSRSFDLTALHQFLATTSGPMAEGKQRIIYPLLLIGFGTLVSLWPFHSWAPIGYASSPAPAVMLHAGVLKKFGLYGLIRLAAPFLPGAVQEYAHLLLILLLGNILYIGWVTLTQKDLNLMLGYSSVMHMGYLFLGFVSLNLIGLTGMVVLMVAHGLSAALLFGLAAVIREKTGTLQMKEIGGLASKAPVLTFLFMVGAFASMGLPGLGNFAGEILIFFGAWHQYPVATILALWGVVLSSVYMTRAVRNIFFGEPGPMIRDVQDLRGILECWPFALLALALAVIGFYPRILTDMIQPTLTLLLGGS